MSVDVCKTCRDCRERKPLEAFPLQKGGRHGRHPLCKLCRAAQERARYARDRDRILERARTNPTTKLSNRWSKLKRQRGVTRDWYLTLVWAQSGRCAICADWFGLQLRVDHDHATGSIRGLLCERCNFGIGNLGDDPAACDGAAVYLERHA